MITDCPDCGYGWDEPIDADTWAKEFIDADSIGQEQMMANLRLLCPHLTIEFRK